MAFLKALTDDRVRCHMAPFDHPELVVPNGHKLTAASNRAADAKLRLKEVGKNGYPAAACAPNTGNLFTYNLTGTGKMLEVGAVATGRRSGPGGGPRRARGPSAGAHRARASKQSAGVFGR